MSFSVKPPGLTEYDKKLAKERSKDKFYTILSGMAFAVAILLIIVMVLR